MASHITPEGWHPWKGDNMFPDKDKTAYYAEYKSTGPGSAVSNRVSWSRQLSAKQAKQYTLRNIFGGNEGWISN
jgi:pectinesterase